MDQLQSDLESYRVQLTQIDMCISSSTDQDEEMIALRDSIKQLIELTEQQLLENKKQELLSMLPQESPPSSPVARVEPVSSFNQNRSENSSSKCESEKKLANGEDDDTMLIGTKMRAPFYSKVRGAGGATLHNAVITEAFDSDDATVRVVYLNPVELAMVACPFFLEGTCRFSNEKCRYSHGEIVSRKSLQDDFKMPDYGLLKEGQPVLAKRSDSLIWEHATCDIVCENEVLVKFNETVSEGLPFACVHPFATSDYEDAHEEPSEEPPNDRFANHSGAIIDEDLMVYIDPSADKLGGWEQHTRGIGSKLMQKMGYVFGTGLGPRSDGRVEPVPVVVCPAGKSLDWIADHRDECEAQASSSLQLRKEKKKSSKRKDSSNMFDLLNVACSSRSSSLTTSKSSSASSASGSKPSSSTASPLNVQSVNQDLAIAKMRQEILRLKESASRQNKAKDPATFKSIQTRLEMTQSKLMSLEKRSSSIDKDKILARERKRLTTF